MSDYADPLEEYFLLVKHLVNLQQKLIQTFEMKAQVSPRLLDALPKLRDKLKNVIKPGQAISQIFSIWPDDIGVLPLIAWVKPNRGFVQFEHQNWFFNLHGQVEISFLGLPSQLNLNVEDFEESTVIDRLRNLPGGPSVEVEYLRGGRTDGVSAWSMLVFSQSIGSKISDLSQSDHERLLEELVRSGFLYLWPTISVGQGDYFVLNTGL